MRVINKELPQGGGLCAISLLRQNGLTKDAAAIPKPETAAIKYFIR